MAAAARRRDDPPVQETPAPPALSVGAQPGRSHAERLELQSFARRLHELMLAKGLSQSELARSIWGKTVDSRGYDVAANRDRISSYLKGRSVPEPANMAKLAKTLGVAVAELAPDAVASAVDRADPAVSMTMIAGHADKTHLRVNQLVHLDIAAKIIALLSEGEKRP